ncbi:MAG: type VI secretion system tip protein VgrG [Propionibacteriaceae bacterium]|nr:type VI secretion system tip protein VgrG [Propionibacteriaceae bacterium]
MEHLELSSDYGQTQLNMGYLLNQSNLFQRSYGFELRTNEWGAIRADKGLLITTYTSDFKQKISHDSPDGHDHMGETLAQSGALIQETEQAINATKDVVAAIVQSKGGLLTALASALPSVAGAVSAAAAALGTGGGGESAVSSNMDPAMSDAQTLLGLSQQIDKPIVSIVSPEGQTMISPKPVVVSSGQSISMRSQAAMTHTAGGQYTQLAKTGMLTQVSTGGQINVVSGGDIVSHSNAGATNVIAKDDASLTSTNANANVVGKVSVLVEGKGQDAFVVGGERVALVCGDASITLLKDGTIIIKGKTGFFKFDDEFDQKGSKIFLNCK